MDHVSASSLYTQFTSYWRRRRGGYQRINISGKRRKNAVELGGSTSTEATGRRKRVWRIKIKAKLKIFKRISAKKFFVWLRDAYVNMMLGFANCRVIGQGYGGSYGLGNCDAFGRGPLKEYDEKMIVEIYRMARRDAARYGSVTVPRLTAIVE